MAAVPTVMVIDDDSDLRAALGFCLQSEGYDVQLCMNGLDAIDRLDFGVHPQAIVLDLMMPGMNGLELLAVLKADPRWSAIPVVVVSVNRGYSAEDLGVALVLRKPFDLPDLISALQTVRGRPGSSGRGLQSAGIS